MVGQHGQESISESDIGNLKLIKGVQIGPYKFNTKISQGKVEWFDEKQFLKDNPPKDIATLTRIATQRITGLDEKLRLVATIIYPKAYFADSTNSIHLTEQSKYSLEYLLALINSKLFQWRFKLTSTNNNVGTNEIESLPFRKIDFNDDKQTKQHNLITNLVKQLITSLSQVLNTQSSNDRDYLDRKCEGLKKQIETIIYEMYGIIEEERRIIELKIIRK